jgi:ATP-dependent 26S proteasome regulatory subunit
MILRIKLVSEESFSTRTFFFSYSSGVAKMFGSALSAVVSAAVTEYLPVSSTALKVALAMFGARAVESMSGETMGHLAERFSGKNSLLVNNAVAPDSYRAIEQHVMEKHATTMRHGELVAPAASDAPHCVMPRPSSATSNKTPFTDVYQNHTIYITLQPSNNNNNNNNNSNNSNSNNNIKLQSSLSQAADKGTVLLESRSADVEMMQEYVAMLQMVYAGRKRYRVVIDAVRDSDCAGRSGTAAAESAIYSKLEEYMVGKYLDKIRTCSFVPKNGEITISVNSASFERSVIDTFQGHPISMTMIPNNSNISNISNISGVSGVNRATAAAAAATASDGGSSAKGSDRIVVESDTACVVVLQKYVAHVVGSVESKRLQSKSKVIRVYRPVIVEGKDYSDAYWSSVFIQTNKCFRNTVVSKEVQKEFVDDIRTFMSGEAKYIERGIPFKRGYILYGVPGTGKTSLIKALANEYSCDVFSIELESITDNNQLMKLLTDVTYHAGNRKYVLVFEDVDRSPLFSDEYGSGGYRPRGSKKAEKEGVSKPALLNAIDGVAEPNNRVLILTANDISVFESEENKAFVRPGRIDKKIEIKQCDNSQIAALFRIFFPPTTSTSTSTTTATAATTTATTTTAATAKATSILIEEDKINVPRALTSAEMINLLMRYENEPLKIRNFLYGLSPEGGETDLEIPVPVDTSAMNRAMREESKMRRSRMQQNSRKTKLKRTKRKLRELVKTVKNANIIQAKLELEITKTQNTMHKHKLTHSKTKPKNKSKTSSSEKMRTMRTPSQPLKRRRLS